MTVQIIRTRVDFFARQRRDETPGARHDGVVIPIEADPALIHRRALGMQVQRARQAAPMWPREVQCRPSAPINAIAREAVDDILSRQHGVG